LDTKDPKLSDIEAAHMKQAHGAMLDGVRAGAVEHVTQMGNLLGSLDDDIVSRMIHLAALADKSELSANWTHLFSFLVGEATAKMGEEWTREMFAVSIAIVQRGEASGVLK
jgi:hypothetical protein